MYAKSFEGRAKGKLVWETRKAGQPFSSASPITNSTQFTGQQNAVTNLGATGTLLTNTIPKAGPGITRIRARVQLDPATSINGQVYGPWRYPQKASNLQGMGAAPLPIELAFFQAELTEAREVKLSWQTASEQNNDYFSIEKSSDALGWEAVKQVAGAGNSELSQSYETIDPEPYVGISYYRLKQVDFDGAYSYSEVRKVELGEDDSEVMLKAYPNPTSDVLIIEGGDQELATIQVFNILGQQVKVSVESVNKNTVSIDISHVYKGIYIIRSYKQAVKVYKE